MAEVALHLEVRKPKSMEEITSLCGKPAAEVEKILFKMAVDGVIKVEKKMVLINTSLSFMFLVSWNTWLQTRQTWKSTQ